MTSFSTGDIGLEVCNLGKTYARSASAPPLFRNLNFTVGRSDRLAILGRNGQGKSTMIKILGGALAPSEGRVNWRMTNSWPIGFSGAFQGSLTGVDNVRFLARVYQRDYKDLMDRVDGFAELGSKMTMPVKHYSSGMRARLAFGLSLAIDFDCYLIDELVAVGDARFQRKCNEELFERRGQRAFIMASHDMRTVGRVCERALIIEGGRAKMFSDVQEAIDIYTWLRAA